MSQSYSCAQVDIYTATEDDLARCLDLLVKEAGPGAAITIVTGEVDVDQAPAAVRSFFETVEVLG